ncbi:chemotaxis protein CheA [Candidatus Symbiobacter mobilis]|uniref:Chemotaxis protein CheA n=1 Tax=Candidatus Symbiobacter mobilis CR TaxID=946483 RepID=U5NCJ4_9BURK|nr:chemotaxis protein CheA [Candidatus Symbiobacter mobilis]AGX87869.1 chemotaxis histidine kinase CheA [Candidatus Symbiobacter mobilis CR]
MNQDADQDFIAAAMPAFISEAGEQTQSIESLLLELEEAPDNRELLDSLFRCAHTVKGSAGIFGLHKIVEFTHHVETLLDKLRDGEVALTPEMSTLLLQCNDQIKFLVQTATDDAADSGDQRDLRADLTIQLRAYTEGIAAPAPAVSSPGDSPTSLTPGSTPAIATWNVSARFGPDTFRNGLDPLSIVKYLNVQGKIRSMVCAVDTVPSLVNLNPETCYLGFTMELESKATREDIEGAFSFVVDDCELDIRAPESPEQKLVRAIETMPSTPRLGDMLVSVGAVTQNKLTEVLTDQERAATVSAGERPKIGNLLEANAGVSPDVVEAALKKQQKARETNVSEENRYIRVQADRLDAVINLLGELVIAGAGANLLARETRNVALIEANLHMNSLIEEIRNGTLGLRMVPVGETFSRFRRVVRDTASSLGKEVNFEIIGGEAELDKSMVEKIADPLMHLVRNSLDHGLEPPQERLAAGKPSMGRLALCARHETGAILIRIEDDGRGINKDRVLQRAWNRGLIEPGIVPSDETIYMMIFEPGFSTADQVTNLSGRGVGMDVVRRNIEALRGSIKLYSRPGKGLQVDIRLPLTLAIIDGFLVGVGKAKFVLPLGSVVEVIEAGGEHVRVDPTGRHCVELRGAVLPVVRLRTLYSIESGLPDRTSVVVVNSPRGKYGIEVEVLLGQQQTVIKPLGRLFRTLRGISGSSILGSGEVALILDVASLGELVTAEHTSVA